MASKSSCLRTVWVIKTLLANENQVFGLPIAFDRKPRLLTSIDGYARFRDVRVRPRAFRVPAQTRAGNGCTSATACCVQAETKPSQTAPPRPTVLDCAALSVAWLDRVTDTGEAGNGSSTAAAVFCTSTPRRTRRASGSYSNCERRSRCPVPSATLYWTGTPSSAVMSSSS